MKSTIESLLFDTWHISKYFLTGASEKTACFMVSLMRCFPWLRFGKQRLLAYASGSIVASVTPQEALRLGKASVTPREASSPRLLLGKQGRLSPSSQ